MPNRSQDPNWKQMIVEMHGTISGMKPTLTKVDKMCENHERRIEALELAKAKTNGYNKAKDKFYERHPVKTAVGGSISIGAVVGSVVVWVLNYLGVI